MKASCGSYEMSLTRRRFVRGVCVAGVPAAVLLSGCSDPVSTASLEATNVTAERRSDGWLTEFVVPFEMTGLARNEGVTGVKALLLGNEGETLHEEELGDYVWKDLPKENRETMEGNVVLYKGYAETDVAATTGTFPFWIGFSYDGFRLTRALPTTSTKGYVGRENGNPPDSAAHEDDWEEVSREEAPEIRGRGGAEGGKSGGTGTLE